MCFCDFELYNGMVLTIVVIGRCYTYVLWQMLLPIIDSVIQLVTDGRLLRPILSVNTLVIISLKGSWQIE